MQTKTLSMLFALLPLLVACGGTKSDEIVALEHCVEQGTLTRCLQFEGRAGLKDGGDYLKISLEMSARCGFEATVDYGALEDGGCPSGARGRCDEGDLAYSDRYDPVAIYTYYYDPQATISQGVNGCELFE